MKSYKVLDDGGFQVFQPNGHVPSRSGSYRVEVVYGRSFFQDFEVEDAVLGEQGAARMPQDGRRVNSSTGAVEKLATWRFAVELKQGERSTICLSQPIQLLHELNERTAVMSLDDLPPLTRIEQTTEGVHNLKLEGSAEEG